MIETNALEFSCKFWDKEFPEKCDMPHILEGNNTFNEGNDPFNCDFCNENYHKDAI